MYCRVTFVLFAAVAAIACEAWAAEQPTREQPADVGAESATHEEIEPLDVEFERLTALKLSPDGNLLACDGQAEKILVIGPGGELVDTIAPGLAPEAIDTAIDGTIYCGGGGTLAKLDGQGRVLKTAEIPDTAASPVSAESKRRAKISNVDLKLRITGIAVTETDIFVAFGSGWSLLSKSKLYRFDRDLENGNLLAEGLRGCCQRCDIAAVEGVVYVAENSAHRVVCFDRDGEKLGQWGKRSRTGLEGFGACCNPMNLCAGSDGVLYTSESGLGRVKRYTTDGEMLDLVGYIGVERFTRGGRQAAACSNIAIAVTPDGDRVYVMDYTQNQVRLLQ